MKIHKQSAVLAVAAMVALVCLVVDTAGFSMADADATVQVVLSKFGNSMENSVAQWQPEAGYPGVTGYVYYGSWEQMLPPPGR